MQRDLRSDTEENNKMPGKKHRFFGKYEDIGLYTKINPSLHKPEKSIPM